MFHEVQGDWLSTTVGACAFPLRRNQPTNLNFDGPERGRLSPAQATAPQNCWTSSFSHRRPITWARLSASRDSNRDASPFSSSISENRYRCFCRTMHLSIQMRSIIPILKLSDDDGPVAACDGHDFPGVIDQCVPSVAAVIDDIVKGLAGAKMCKSSAFGNKNRAQIKGLLAVDYLRIGADSEL